MDAESRIEKLKEFSLENPHDPFLMFALSIEYVNLGQLQEAGPLFEKLVVQYPDYTGTYYHYGKFLEKKGDTSKAIDMYEKGLEVTEERGELHANKELMEALNLCRQGNVL